MSSINQNVLSLTANLLQNATSNVIDDVFVNAAHLVIQEVCSKNELTNLFPSDVWETYANLCKGKDKSTKPELKTVKKKVSENGVEKVVEEQKTVNLSFKPVVKIDSSGVLALKYVLCNCVYEANKLGDFPFNENDKSSTSAELRKRLGTSFLAALFDFESVYFSNHPPRGELFKNLDNSSAVSKLSGEITATMSVSLKTCLIKAFLNFVCVLATVNSNRAILDQSKIVAFNNDLEKNPKQVKKPGSKSEKVDCKPKKFTAQVVDDVGVISFLAEQNLLLLGCDGETELPFSTLNEEVDEFQKLALTKEEERKKENKEKKENNEKNKAEKAVASASASAPALSTQTVSDLTSSSSAPAPAPAVSGGGGRRRLA